MQRKEELPPLLLNAMKEEENIFIPFPDAVTITNGELGSLVFSLLQTHRRKGLYSFLICPR